MVYEDDKALTINTAGHLHCFNFESTSFDFDTNYHKLPQR